MKRTRFVSVTLSERLADDLDELARYLGISRSGLLSALTADSFEDGLGAGLRAGVAGVNDVYETAAKYSHHISERAYEADI